MKKQTAFILMSLLATNINSLHAQYQLVNGGFEGAWNKVEKGMEPLGWRSLGSCSGAFADRSEAVQFEASLDVRPGSTDKRSAKFYAASNFNKALWNGIITTGRLHINSQTTADTKSNYSYTDTLNSNYNNTFTGLPDSLTLWVKFQPKQENSLAHVSAVLHDNFSYQSQTANELMKSHVVASAEKDYTCGNKDWQKLSIPFIYNENNTADPAFALLTLRTNATAGGGDAEDAIWVDDVKMVYNSQLSSLSVNGSVLEGFDSTIFNYVLNEPYQEGTLSVSSNARAAQIITSYEPFSAIATIRVEGQDYNENPANFHEYTVQFAPNYMDSQFTGTYTENLSVLVNGQKTAPQDASITVTINKDSTYNLALKELVLKGATEESATPIGNLYLSEIPATEETATSLHLVNTQNSTLSAGSLYEASRYLGPIFGETSATVDATIADGKMTASINLYIPLLNQALVVTFKEINPVVTTDISETLAEASTALRIYNPIDGVVSVQGGNSGETYRIFSQSAVLVQTGKLGSGTTEINTKQLPRGLYILKTSKKVAKFIR